MIDPLNVPELGVDESLARYVLQSSHIRQSNGTLKPDAFIPHPYRDLSMTRHLLASEAELRAIGENIAAAIGKTFYGRGDIRTSVCLAQKLLAKADPVPGNPNHASVSDWPGDKPAQKIIAQEIAAMSIFIAKE
jgi:hypothetical protein